MFHSPEGSPFPTPIRIVHLRFRPWKPRDSEWKSKVIDLHIIASINDIVSPPTTRLVQKCEKQKIAVPRCFFEMPEPCPSSLIRHGMIQIDPWSSIAARLLWLLLFTSNLHRNCGVLNKERYNAYGSKLQVLHLTFPKIKRSKLIGWIVLRHLQLS